MVRSVIKEVFQQTRKEGILRTNKLEILCSILQLFIAFIRYIMLFLFILELFVRHPHTHT